METRMDQWRGGDHEDRQPDKEQGIGRYRAFFETWPPLLEKKLPPDGREACVVGFKLPVSMVMGSGSCLQTFGSQPGINPAIQEIDNEIGEHHGEADKQQDHLDHGQITVGDGSNQKPANARPGKYALDNHRTGNQ